MFWRQNVLPVRCFSIGRKFCCGRKFRCPAGARTEFAARNHLRQLFFWSHNSAGLWFSWLIMEELKEEKEEFTPVDGFGAVPTVIVHVGNPQERVVAYEMGYFEHGLPFYQFIAGCCELHHGLQRSEEPGKPPVIVISEVSVEQWKWIRRVEDKRLGIAGVLRDLEDVKRFGRACMFLGVVGARDRMDVLFRSRLLWNFSTSQYVSWDHRVSELTNWKPPMAPLVLEARLRVECESVLFAVLVAVDFGFFEERCGDLVYSMLGNSNAKYMKKGTFSAILTGCVGADGTSYFCTQVRRSLVLTFGQEDDAGVIGRTNTEFARRCESITFSERVWRMLLAKCR